MNFVASSRSASRRPPRVLNLFGESVRKLLGRPVPAYGVNHAIQRRKFFFRIRRDQGGVRESVALLRGGSPAVSEAAGKLPRRAKRMPNSMNPFIIRVGTSPG